MDEDSGAPMVTQRDEVLVVPRSKHIIIDNIGAADAFVGGFIAAAVKGKSNTRCLLWAHACGAISCFKEGAQGSLPYPNEVRPPSPLPSAGWRPVRLPPARTPSHHPLPPAPPPTTSCRRLATRTGGPHALVRVPRLD